MPYNDDKKDDHNGNNDKDNNDDGNGVELRRGFYMTKYTRHKTKNYVGGDMELDIKNRTKIFRFERMISQNIHY